MELGSVVIALVATDHLPTSLTVNRADFAHSAHRRPWNKEREQLAIDVASNLADDIAKEPAFHKSDHSNNVSSFALTPLESDFDSGSEGHRIHNLM